jgi:hypothetical protein
MQDPFVYAHPVLEKIPRLIMPQTLFFSFRFWKKFFNYQIKVRNIFFILSNSDPLGFYNWNSMCIFCTYSRILWLTGYP